MGNVKRVLLLIFTIISFQLFSQSPEKINYQSIVRDLAGNVIQNQPISLRMSILSDSINGTIVYQETFQPTTNNFGLVNIKIGEGVPVIATMSSVDWSNGPFFLESAVDVTGGTNYIVVSTSQFMSVPYALYAKESPLDTTQVQNIVNQQTYNFLDSSSIQNMIDSSVINIDSTLIASWGYIDSNSIMILINNNSLDSTTIQNMIDNSIVNIDSSTVASWGYLDSSTIQILINNSTIDSSSVANWGYLDSTTIQNIITQQTNNYLDSTSVQNMIDNSVTNIDSSTVASWGYVDSSSIMILINNNSLDSAAIQNMINSSITNVDSSTVASWGYLDSSSIIALISNSNIDSSSVANWGYLDSVSIQNMINNSSVNVDSTMIANFGFVAGPHTIDTDTQIDSTGIANYGFVTSSQVLDSVSIQNMINNSSSNVDSSTVSNWGFVDSNDVINLINQSGFLDSLTIQSMIDSMIAQSSSSSGSGSGTSLIYPDGFVNMEAIYDYSGSYVVPTGKNLYVPGFHNLSGITTINGKTIFSSSNLGTNPTTIDLRNVLFNPLILGPNDTISSIGNSPPPTYSLGVFGFLVDEIVNPVCVSLSSDYQVPQGKKLVVTNVYSENGMMYTDSVASTFGNWYEKLPILQGFFNCSSPATGQTGVTSDPGNRLSQPLIFNENDVLRDYDLWSEVIINGYLVDNDYFSLSSNSGSGSNSSIDSTTVANWGFSTDTDTQIDSTGIANLGYVAGPHTIDTDTQIDSAGIAAMGYLDSVSIRNMIDSMVAQSVSSVSGPSLSFPEGISGTSFSISLNGTSSSYTVPSGKNLYILNTYNSGTGFLLTTISGIQQYILGTYQGERTFDSPIIISEGESISPSSGTAFTINGLLIDKNPSITIENLYLYGTSSSYTVPSGKNLYILNTYNSGTGFLLTTISGIQQYILGTYQGERTFDSPIIISEGESISPSSGTAFTINGYLADNNYFSSSSNTGSGSNSTIDSTTVANWGFSTDTDTQIDSTGIAGYGYVAGPHTIDTDTQIDSAGIAAMGYLDSVSIRNMIDSMVAQSVSSSGTGFVKTFNFPEGFDGYGVVHNFINNSSYTVPSGKRLYITSVRGGDPLINNIKVNKGTVGNSIIVSSGQVVTHLCNTSSTNCTFSGFLVDELSDISSIIHSFSNGNYTVPSGNRLYILSWEDGNPYVDNLYLPAINYQSTPIVVNPGQVLSSSTTNSVFNGYLAPIDYFSSSSSSGSNSTIDSTTISNMGFVDSMTVVNMINSGGGSGIDFQYPDGKYGDIINIQLKNQFIGGTLPTSYVVPAGKTFYILNANIYSTGTGGAQGEMYIDGVEYVKADGYIGTQLHNPIPVASGSTITVGDYGNFNGLLINEGVQIVNIQLKNQFIGGTLPTSYVVPSGKTFYILNANIYSTGTGFAQGEMYIDGVEYVKADGYIGNQLLNPIPVASGSTITVGDYGNFNGYLVDSDFFNSSGSSSGSGSNLTIDSTTVANWGFSTDTDTQIDSTGIANLGYVAGPHTIDTDTQIDSAGIAAMGFVAGSTDTQIDSAGIASHGFLDSVRIMELINQNGTNSTKTFGWPQGYGGDLVSFNFNQADTTYVVPPGKNLYIVNSFNKQENSSFSGSAEIRINQLSYWSYSHNNSFKNLLEPIILKGNDTVNSIGYLTYDFLGLLYDTSSAIEIIHHNFHNSLTYTVPNGKIFIYKSNVPIIINGGDVNSGDEFFISKAGNVISYNIGLSNSYSYEWLRGYLVDEDYFKTDSGSSSGSGSGSSSGSGSNANTLIYTTSGF